MNTPALKLVLCFFALVFNAQTCEAKALNRPRALVYLGSADGKSFFADTAVGRNWTEAKNFCISSQMNLASITSLNQMNLIKNRTDGIATPRNRYWTAGRDALTLKQVAWDTNGETPTDGLAEFLAQVSYQTCLAFVPTQFGDTGYQLWLCTDTYGTLCEINPSGKKQNTIDTLFAQSVKISNSVLDNVPVVGAD